MADVAAKLMLKGTTVTSAHIAEIVSRLEQEEFEVTAANDVFDGPHHDGFEIRCRKSFPDLIGTSSAWASAKDKTRNRVNAIVNDVALGALHGEKYLIDLLPLIRE